MRWRGRISRTTLVVLAVAAVAAVGATAAAIATFGSQSFTIASKPVTHAATACTLSGTGSSTDAVTDEKNPTTNSSGTTTLSISPRSSNRKYAWIQFSFGSCSLPANAVVDSATLTVNVTTASSGRTITVSPASATWTAASITWNTQPTAGAATGTFSAATTGAKTVDVSADVDGWVDGSTTNTGWELADLGASANVTPVVGGAANATAGNRPTLTINYAN